MDGYVTIGTKLDTKSFDAQIAKLEKKLETLEKSADESNLPKKFRRSAEETANLNAEIEKTKNQLADLYKKQAKIGKTDYSGLKDSVDGVGKSIKKVTRRIAKMALAVFGIRSAFMFVRNSINTIAQDDDQLSDDIQYMKIALAYTIEPIVRAIVNLARQLMFYVGYIVKAWTGRNIFANANKGLENANKQAKGLNKELNKTTASFDEMNTLSSSGGGSDNLITPSFDFGDIENQPVPEWLKFIVDHKDEIIAALAGIAGGLVAIKAGLAGIQGLGIGIAVAGLARTIQKIIDFIKKPTFKNFMGILEGIAMTVGGIALAFGAWPVAIGAAIALVVIELVNHFEEVREMFNNIIKWIDTDFRSMMTRVFGPLGNIIVEPFKVAVTFISNLFDGLFGGMKKIIEGIVELFKGNFKGGISRIFDGMLDILMAPFNAMNNLVRNIFTNVTNFIIDAINVLIDGLNKIKIPGTKIGVNLKRLKRIGESSGGGGSRAKGGIFYPSKLPKLAVGGIINQPGSGVPYHGAYIGERGAEAVVPLTDSQQMALLGETIGKYINISATIPVYVGNRKVAREIRKVQANENFAFNR